MHCQRLICQMRVLFVIELVALLNETYVQYKNVTGIFPADKMCIVTTQGVNTFLVHVYEL